MSPQPRHKSRSSSGGRNRQRAAHKTQRTANAPKSAAAEGHEPTSPELGQAQLVQLQQAVRTNPQSGEAWLALAEALERAGHVQKTYTAYAEAFRLLPQSHQVQLALGRFLLERGELDDAERMFRMAAGAGVITAVTGLATVLERRGDVKGALALIERFDAGIDHSMSLLLLKARLLLRSKKAEEALALLSSVQVPPSPIVQVYFHYLLGDVHDALGNVDEAFAAWTRANALRGLHFDAAKHTAAVDRIIARNPLDGYASKPRSSIVDPLPILIVGLPRSGTSLVEQILASHPEVHGAGELDYVKDIVLTADLSSQASLDTNAKRYLDRLHALGPGKARVTDKMPHNFFHLGGAGQVLPGARVIHCQRNLLDTGLSCYSKHFNVVHNYANDLEAMAHFFKEYLRLMDHWRALRPLPMFELQYEALVSDPEPVVRKLVEFCELPWDPGVMRFHESGRYVSTASYAQVRQPLYKSAMGRAGRYLRHLEPLRAALGLTV